MQYGEYGFLTSTDCELKRFLVTQKAQVVHVSVSRIAFYAQKTTNAMASTSSNTLDIENINIELNRLDRAVFIVSGYLHQNNFTDVILDLIKIIATYYLLTDQWSPEYKVKDMKILEG